MTAQQNIPLVSILILQGPKDKQSFSEINFKADFKQNGKFGLSKLFKMAILVNQKWQK